VLAEGDPTAHAELKCIREGAKKLGRVGAFRHDYYCASKHHQLTTASTVHVHVTPLTAGSDNSMPGQLAAPIGDHTVRDAGAVPHVRGGGAQREVGLYKFANPVAP
jgi:hypothetical protein